jgi:membrane-bound lytic murein transglycosylase D
MSFSRRGSSAVSALLAAMVMTGSGAIAFAATEASPRRKTTGSVKSAASTLSTGAESVSERRAVRGVPVDELGVSESTELRELRRFEEQAFSRGDAPDAIDPEAGATGLRGRWSGTGDVPAELRTPETSQRTPPPAGEPDSDWLRTLKSPELPVRWDPQVLRYLDYFRGDAKGRAVMANWLRRAGRYREMVEKILDRYGLPKDLFYVAMVESGFDSSARSRTGAGGIWQFMPSAARTYGLEISYWTDGRRDPERSADAAARYLKDLYVRFGSWPLVFAAYNAGYGAVLTSITRYNTNDYWELCRHESGLPWESSIYVPKIMAAAIIGHNLEAFGFADITPDPPFAFDRVDAPAGTTFTALARASGTRPEVIASLNGHLLRERTPPDRGVVAVRIPVGTTALYSEAFERSRSAADRVDTVVLRFGETIDEVAKARGLAPRVLRRLNGVKDSAELRAGVTIVVPSRPVVVASASKTAPADEASDAVDKTEHAGVADGPDDEQTIVAVPDRVFSYDGRERVFYRTRDGDSIDEIAETFSVLGDDLIEWNNLDPTAKLQPRLVLQIYVRKDFDPAGVLLLDPARVRVVTLGSEEFLELETARRGKKRLFYTAKVGDTLVRVGRRYGLTAGDLARINRFSYNTELHDGQKIVVYSPTGDAPRELSMGMTPESKRPESKRPESKPSSTTAAARTKGGSPAPTVIAKANTNKTTGTKTTTGIKSTAKSVAGGGSAAAARVAKKK